MRTFKMGGFHPQANKRSGEKAIRAIELPEKGYILLGQHIGKPATPIVKPGDHVRTGQLIAEADGMMSANIHSPFTGKVLKTETVWDATGAKRDAVVIEVEEDDWDLSVDLTDEYLPSCRMETQEIIGKIKAMGIVGMGGAAFPTHVKLTPPEGKKAEILLINGAECEPYLTADHRLMVERGREILAGIHILMRAANVNEAYLGIEENKPDAIAVMEEQSGKLLGFEVVRLQERYPQGGEKQLIEAITGRKVPAGKLPIDVGVVVCNVGTAHAVYEAVQKNKPLVERVLTVSGPACKHPQNLLVRVGTPVAHVLKEAMGDVSEWENVAGKIISGGPMMGKALRTAETPVVKGMSGILLMEQNEARRREADVCIRCGRCMGVCPMGLEPYLLAKYAEHGLWAEAKARDLLNCIECGSCAASCPSARPLLDEIRVAKGKVRSLKR